MKFTLQMAHKATATADRINLTSVFPISALKKNGTSLLQQRCFRQYQLQTFITIPDTAAPALTADYTDTMSQSTAKPDN